MDEVRTRDYIEGLTTAGRYVLTSAEALTAIGGSPAAVRARLRLLKQQGHLAEPERSFHVIVPPEYRRLGCLPAEQFIDPLMRLHGQPYYLGLLSAAERHGAAHQRPQSCQVMVPKNRPAIVCGRVRVEFIARADLARMPVVEINTPRGTVRCSTPEVTALELLGYPNHAGGLSNVATVLSELAERLSPSELVAAARLSPTAWAQRLGYLLELLGHDELIRGLADFVRTRAVSYVPLRRAASVVGAGRSPAWKVVVNATVEPDA